jgi:hypothetical protein
LVVELKKKPVWQTHIWVLTDNVKWELVSQAVQTEVLLQVVQPALKAEHSVHTPEKST